VDSRRVRGLATVAIVLCLTGCTERAREADAESAAFQGARIETPVEGVFPRTGLQWRYATRVVGFDSSVDKIEWLAYRLVRSDSKRRHWSSRMFFGGFVPELRDGSYEVISGSEAFLHPPRHGGFWVLEYAPFPQATPGRAGTGDSVLHVPEAWCGVGSLAQDIPLRTENLGFVSIAVPAGYFERGWLVRSESPRWQGEFIWVERVGFVRMAWTSSQGHSLTLELAEVRDVGESEE